MNMVATSYAAHKLIMIQKLIAGMLGVRNLSERDDVPGVPLCQRSLVSCDLPNVPARILDRPAPIAIGRIHRLFERHRACFQSALGGTRILRVIHGRDARATFHTEPVCSISHRAHSFVSTVGTVRR